MGDATKINGAPGNLPAGVGQGQGAAANGVGLKNTSHNHPKADPTQGNNDTQRGNGRNDAPGVNGRGNGNGQQRVRGNQTGQSNKPDVSPRIRENESQARQIRNRIENSQPKSERLGDDTPGRDRVNDGLRTRGDDDGGNSRRDGGVQLRSYVGDDRSRTQTDDGRPRTTFNDQRGQLDRPNSSGGEQSNSPGRSEFGHSHNADNNSINGNNGNGNGHGNGNRGSNNNAPLSNSPNAPAWGTTTHGNPHTNGTAHTNVGRLVEGVGDRLGGAATRLVDGLTHGNGHGNGHAYGVEAHRLLDSAVNAAASRLDHITSSGVRPTRAELAAALGLDAGDKTVGKVFKLLEHALKHVGQDVGRAHQVDNLFAHVRGDGSSGSNNGAHNSIGKGAEHLAREVVKDLASALQLGRHLNHLEKTGGNVVRHAEAAIAHALYDAGRAVERAPVGRPALPVEPTPVTTTTTQALPTPQSLPTPQPTHAPQQAFPVERPTPQEVLRDLRAGAFLPAQERYNPFPLTGRARVAAEMMELMRTLDAVEGALRRASDPLAAQRSLAESAVAAWLRAKAGVGAAPENVAEELAMLLTPSLPGRAARALIPAHVAAMNGLLTDADGRALLARDGTPLKLERLLWLNAAGGLLGSAFKGEGPSSRLSPALLYGFDAIYTVVGFDGRTLAAPHFVAVQAAANESESEWLFGQQPLTVGWTRELIERLKDSAVVEHNLLGETLEEALADGRFHVALLSVEVNEGAPAPETSAVRNLLPGAAAALA